MFNYNKKNYILIIFVCLISACIHFYPSMKSNYPMGFDTYRLHTIRINYIINDGIKILGDLVSPDFLNPIRYQWGFHLILGTIGIIIGEDSLTLLRVLPFFLGFLFPLSIYIASPFFGVNDRKTRLLATIISPFTLSNPVIHGLIYPFPSSMGLILFTIGLRIIYEAKNSKTWKLLSILLIPTYFFIYKGLGVIYAITLLTLTPSLFIPKDYKFSLFGKTISLETDYASFYACLFTSTIITLSLGYISFKVYSSLDLWNLPPPAYLNIPEIYKIYQVSGITNFILFLISTSYIIFQSLKNKKLSKYYLGLVTFFSITILSAGCFSPTRWILYALPIIITFNGIFIAKLINTLQSKKISIIFQNLIIICLICLFASETVLQLLQIYPTYAFSPNFTEEETQVITKIESLQNNSIVFTDYRMNRLLNAYAINKTLLYTSSGKSIHFHEIGRRDYSKILYRNDLSLLSNLNEDKSIYILISKSFTPEIFQNIISSANEIFYQNKVFSIIRVNLNPIPLKYDFHDDENENDVIDPWNKNSRYNGSSFNLYNSDTQQIIIDKDVASISLPINIIKNSNILEINFSFTLQNFSQNVDQSFKFSLSQRRNGIWYSIDYYFSTNESMIYGAENSSSRICYINIVNNNVWYDFKSKNFIQVFNNTFNFPLQGYASLTIGARSWGNENSSIKIKKISLIKDSYWHDDFN